MFYTIDLELFEPDYVTVEVEIYFYPADYNTDASDWDSFDYWEISKCSVFSNGKEIDLELDDKFLYSKVKERLREIDLMDVGGF
jgi:hypothetical protein